MRCAECGGEMVVSHEPLTEEYHGEQITVKDLEYHVCQECGEVTMSVEEADKQARKMARAYAIRHAILSPEEIKRIREDLGLTQEQFETIVGVSRPSACRWERGSVQPSASANNVMRLIRDVPGVAEYLMTKNEIVRRGERRNRTAASVQFEVMTGGKQRGDSKGLLSMAKEG